MIRDILDAVRFRMEQMLADNPSRVNFYERYRNIIEELPESCYGDMADYQNQIFTYVSNRYGNAV